MKTALSAFALIAALGLSGASLAQVPSGGGGSDAKGNAPLKTGHTVNDGGARRGASSFTEAQARRHIVHAGYASVTGLTKGKDGVWRGVATKSGASVNVGLDFKGNVSEGEAMASTKTETLRTTNTMGAAASTPAPMAASTQTMGSSSTTTTSSSSLSDSTMAKAEHPRRRHHRRHHRRHCVNPTPNGAACSGVDRNKNGISDKEDRAIKSGAHP